MNASQSGRPRYRSYSLANLAEIGARYGLADELIEDIRIVASVFPFKTNAHVLDMIDFSRAPEDEIYTLTFPRREMLDPDDYTMLAGAQRAGFPLEPLARRIRDRLNPHCSGQVHDVPTLHGRPVDGLQHKYRETVLVFPAAAQTCHAYCTFCFRFPQFVKTDAGKFALRDPALLRDYLLAHPEVSDVIYTGGDPMIAASTVLRRFVEPVLDVKSVRSIRFGTKSLAYWPQRFTQDDDADDLLRLFHEIVQRGKHLTLIYHSSHPRELDMPHARAAIRRVRNTGVEVRTQAAIMRGVNDHASTWRALWSEQTRLGCIPYYAFAGRPTGAHTFFDVPLSRSLGIIQDATRDLPGIATTVRGPVMSTSIGKIAVLGTLTVGGRRAFALRFVRAADRDRNGDVFLAAYDPCATWLDDLRPFEGGQFPFEPSAFPIPGSPAYRELDAVFG